MNNGIIMDNYIAISDISVLKYDKEDFIEIIHRFPDLKKELKT